MSVKVDPSNAGQLTAWEGGDGDFWVAHADRLNDQLAGYHEPFLAAAGVQGNDEVLDIGCGPGWTTRQLAGRVPGGQVLGIDLSPQLLELARGRAAEEGLGNVTFEQADAQVEAFPEGHFDVVVSRNGAQFFGDPVAAYGNIHRATKPGGRLVLMVWHSLDRNEWLNSFRAILTGRTGPMPDGPGPFSMSDPARVRELLTSVGYQDVRFTEVTAPMWFGEDVDDAIDFITRQFGGMLNSRDEDGRARAVAELGDNAAEHVTGDGVTYASATWFVEAQA
ncbi:methyltransferase domain-containing protein [Kibdelosporangium lantanae]